MTLHHSRADSAEAERALARYRLLSEHARDIMLFVRPDGRIVEANTAAVSAYGYTREELLALSVFDLRLPEDREAVSRHLAEATAGSVSFETLHRRRDGSRFPVEVNSQSADVGGERLLFSVVRDVSDRKRTERALRDSEERFRLATRALSGVVYDWDISSGAIQRSEGLREITGYGEAEVPPLIGWWSERVHPEDAGRVEREFQEAVASRSPVCSSEYRLRHRDGHYLWVWDRGRLLYDGEGRAVRMIGAMVSVDERRRAEEALRQSEERLRLALTASRAGVWSWEVDSGIVSWSPENHVLYGLEPIPGGLRFLDWESRIHPDDRARAVQAVRDALEGRTPEFRIEFRIVHPERGVRWLLGLGRVERAPDGRPLRMSGINLDVTQRRETEARLQQAQRVQSVGRLAGGIAHEVNNLMTAVLGFGSFAVRELDPDHPAATEVAQMIKAGERAAAITRQLLAFTRQQVLRPARLDINGVVRELVPVLERLLGAEHQLVLRLETGLGEVQADRGQLEQVLVNLTLNSRDAMRGSGTVMVATQATELDSGTAERHPGIELRRGRYILLSISDTGVGMDESTRARVFEPFFTTKPVGQGTGLGLSTVYGIVKQSDGYLWLYSEPGLGTTVKVYLPMVEASPATEEVPARLAGAPASHGEIVLIAEDEPTVRSLARRTLELHGYRVLEAADGRAALELLEQLGGGVDLVLSDAVMPELSGRALGEMIGARWPAIPVIYMSGYPGKEVVDRGLVNPDAPFVAKPFTPEALARRIREVLDAARVWP